MTDQPKPKPILSEAERATMRATTERATRSALEAIREGRDGSRAYRRGLMSATRAIEPPPDVAPASSA